MNPTLFFYNAAALAASCALPGFWLGDKFANRFPEFWPRVSLYRHIPPAPKGPRVWLQAVSVGEVHLARQIATELLTKYPQINLTVTTSTAKGLEKAREILGEDALVTLFPLDLPWSVICAAKKIRPDVYASLETEIWPNLLSFLDSQGASLFMLNGRISPRSFPKYRKAKSFVKNCLNRFKHLSMITDQDARRVTALGADPAKVTVDGNAKYAGLMEKVAPENLKPLEKLLNLQNAPLIVAGSVRSGEEEPVLKAYKKLLTTHKNAVLACVPRHIENSVNWAKTADKLELTTENWSSLSPDKPKNPKTQVVIVDAMGVLFNLYGLAKVAFVGASLVPLGGQNPMEPAAWGVPVCYGKSMEDFLDAKQALEQADASSLVETSGDMALFWQQALENETKNQQLGTKVVKRWSNAASKAADIIIKDLKDQGRLS